IWKLFGEDWAVMFTDLSGFSKIGREYGYLYALEKVYISHLIQYRAIGNNDGTITEMPGDGLVVVFRQPELAVKAAIEMMQAAKRYNALISNPKQQVHIHVGIGYGRMLALQDKKLFGNEINSAANLLEEAKADEIAVSKSVHDNVPANELFAYSPYFKEEGGYYKVQYK
ncbi:MAG TPA: adenylate/guanylate cyclase domain-containing protein, partial [Elusimicrobiales bacterium]|nr:adenylate/guanylate cyclase domain-containing protein [Elusimicrobiales bacterium]